MHPKYRLFQPHIYKTQLGEFHFFFHRPHFSQSCLIHKSIERGLCHIAGLVVHFKICKKNNNQKTRVYENAQGGFIVDPGSGLHRMGLAQNPGNLGPGT